MAEKIGQILIRKGRITAAQLREALRTQQFFGGYLGSHLINLGFIDEASLGETLSEIYRVPFAPFETLRLARPDAVGRLPSSVAQRFRVVPIQIEGNRIHLAMLNPRDTVAVNEVSIATGLRVAPWVAPEFRIMQALEKHYKIRRETRGSISMRLSVEDEPSGDFAALFDEPPRPADVPAESVGVAPARTERPAVETELGLDGHPIHATVVPELGGGLASSPPPGSLPRSLEEWRDQDFREEDFEEGQRRSRGTRDRPGRRPGREGPERETLDEIGSDPFLGEPQGSGEVPGNDLPEGEPRSRTAPEPSFLAPEDGPELPRALGPASAAGAGPRDPDRAPIRPQGRAEARARGVLSIEEGPSKEPQGARELDRVAEALAAAPSRDDLAREVVAFTAERFRRAAIFAVLRNNIIGWTGSGPGVDRERLARLSIPSSQPSLFSHLESSPNAYVGVVPALPESLDFYGSLGWDPPSAILLVPMRLGGRLVAILYGDNQSGPLGPIDLSLWNRLARMTEVSLEILILRNKMRQM